MLVTLVLLSLTPLRGMQQIMSLCGRRRSGPSLPSRQTQVVHTVQLHDEPAEAIFTITREQHVSGVPWGGYMVAYTHPDHAATNPQHIGVTLTGIDPIGPAVKAGMDPREHDGWFIVAVNGQECWSLDDRFATCNMLMDETKQHPGWETGCYTITIRRPTHDDEAARKATCVASFVARMHVILDKAAHDNMLDKLLGSQEGVAQLQEYLGIADGSAADGRMQLFIDEITRRGWKGEVRAGMRMNLNDLPPHIRDAPPALQKMMIEAMVHDALYQALQEESQQHD